MKHAWQKGLLGLLLLLLAAPAFAAGIDNTHHSLKDYLTTGSRYTCFACHGYQDTVAATAGLGKVGSFCYARCHIGSGGGFAIGAAAVNPGNVGAYDYSLNTVTTSAAAAVGSEGLASGHGMTWASLPTKDSYTALRSTLNAPYMAGAMECTTCHDVHNNTYAPFLRAPLSMAATTNEHAALAAVTDTFCVKCHNGTDANGSQRYNLIANTPNGTHVIELDNTGAATRTGGTRHNRSVVFRSTLFMTRTSWGTSLNGAAGTAWNTGAKLGGTATADGANVGCYTCHQVHMNSAHAAPTGQTYKWLTSMAYSDNTTEPSAAVGDDLCVGCHGNTTAGQNENPGVTAYFHPVNASAIAKNATDLGNALYTVTTPAAFDIAVNISGKHRGAGNRLVCTSCHAPAHTSNPVGGSMILSPLAPTCATCHNALTKQTGGTPNSHHVYGGGTDYTAAANGGYPQPTWRNGTSDNVVTLADGLQCQDCHTFNKTAHNW